MSQLPELDEVQENFNMGIICAQQVLAHFADRLNLPEETALRLASAFGAGMGKAEVCGCVSGALMVLGLMHGPSGPCPRPQKQAFYDRSAKSRAASLPSEAHTRGRTSSGRAAITLHSL